MPLRLLVREDFSARVSGEMHEFSKHERITEPRVIGQVLASHPDFVIREEVPTVELDEPDATVPPKVPQRAPKPHQS
jgi:hypothetical protein